MIIIKIDDENDAFQEGNLTTETVRILRDLCDRMEGGEQEALECHYLLYDVNGNKVGYAIHKA
jgi:hypothetical protein